MEQIAALEKERDNLARELSSYISKDKDQASYPIGFFLSFTNSSNGKDFDFVLQNML